MRRLLLGLLFVSALVLVGCEGDERSAQNDWRGERYPYGYAPQDGDYGAYGYVPPDGYYGGENGEEAGEAGGEERAEGER